MPTSVTMPQLGESVTEGTVTRWLKAVGDSVQADEPLLEVSTDKVDTEIPAPASGVLSAISVNEDEVAQVGAQLAVIDEAGTASGGEAAAATAPAPQAAAPQAAPQEAPPAPEAAAPEAAAPEAAPQEAPPAPEAAAPQAAPQEAPPAPEAAAPAPEAAVEAPAQP
ncbi:MAG: hypothetical protein QOJ92_2585, partial [Frankiales bacterium]|nr:hypothetical protein [Frankiales bacterium]